MSTGISWLDFKLGVRMLVRYPGLTLVAVVGMAVAIAISAAAFGLVHRLLDPSVPLDEGDRVIALQNWTPRPTIRRTESSTTSSPGATN